MRGVSGQYEWNPSKTTDKPVRGFGKDTPNRHIINAPRPHMQSSHRPYGRWLAPQQPDRGPSTHLRAGKTRAQHHHHRPYGRWPPARAGKPRTQHHHHRPYGRLPLAPLKQAAHPAPTPSPVRAIASSTTARSSPLRAPEGEKAPPSASPPSPVRAMAPFSIALRIALALTTRPPNRRNN